MIEVKDLSIKLGEFSLKNINLEINDGEYFVILGPTGAGKTVLLECIAGLHRIRQGEIWLGGEDITRLAPEERNVGYVPQDYVLFPFLSAIDNISFGLKPVKGPRREIKERAETVADLMGISHLLHRDIRSLSGGEKQRVALARALAPSPGILLLDEPLGALDLQTSKNLRLELRRVHRELGIITVHITHDLMEAVEMADRVAIIQGGRVEQVAEPERVLFYPEGETVSDFIGGPNIIDCDSCRMTDQGVVEADCGGLKLIVPHESETIHKLAILPRHIYISESRPPGRGVNGFTGTITDIKYARNTVRLWLEVVGKTLVAELPYFIFEKMDLAVGKEVFLILRMRRIRVYENNSL
jgi:molybdate/tungstate transport system ATP-binding protein